MNIKHKKIPSKIVNIALDILSLYLTGEIKARKTYRYKYLSLKVNRNYRLLYRKDKWLLLSHEDYNKLLDR